MSDDAYVSSLHLYPVKGCRGIDLDAAEVVTTGLAAAGVGDREWMVTGSDGRFLTQRELQRLALVEPEIADERLRLRAPHMPPLEVALSLAKDSRAVVVWRSDVRGFDAGESAARWLSDWLACDARLVRFDRSVTRHCNRDWVGSSGAHTLFADGYPVLVIGRASLCDLNDRLRGRGDPTLPMNRFRPNIVIDGLPAYDEDHLDTIRIGDVVLRLVKPCIRCQVTTTDQATAKVGVEPLPTLGEFRMDERLDGVRFGMNAIVIAGEGGAIATGAPATVTYRF
ncbi:MAG: MOSC N-terminal beta barrel domain-containing protein [Burkholderiales bacterium]|nr:MOSC N-terminal beta barrel domain-containing protein [Burkholderiales bacterium]